MPEAATAKPEIGEVVHFYDPELLRKVGFERGYRNRGAGPYAAIVVNENGVGLDLFVLYPDNQPPFVREKIPEHALDRDEQEPTKPHWKWLNNAQKARAEKRLKDRATA